MLCWVDVGHFLEENGEKCAFFGQFGSRKIGDRSNKELSILGQKLVPL